MSSQESAEWDVYEDNVYDAISKALQNGYLPFEPAQAKVIRKAEYKAPATGNLIKMEVAVEVYRKGAELPCIVWLWECKHKEKRAVEVGDVRELHSKLQELGVGGYMGSIVTTVGFQSGAEDLANALRIGLYLLKEELRPVTLFARDLGTELRKVIIAPSFVSPDGIKGTNERFADLVRWPLIKAYDERDSDAAKRVG